MDADGRYMVEFRTYLIVLSKLGTKILFISGNKPYFSVLDCCRYVDLQTRQRNPGKLLPTFIHLMSFNFILIKSAYFGFNFNSEYNIFRGLNGHVSS